MRVVDMILFRDRFSMRVADVREQSKKGNEASIGFGLKAAGSAENFAPVQKHMFYLCVCGADVFCGPPVVRYGMAARKYKKQEDVF